MALLGAIDTDDTDTAAEAAMALLEGFLLTQVRIVEALEDIRMWGVGQSVPPED